MLLGSDPERPGPQNGTDHQDFLAVGGNGEGYNVQDMHWYIDEYVSLFHPGVFPCHASLWSVAHVPVEQCCHRQLQPSEHLLETVYVS